MIGSSYSTSARIVVDALALITIIALIAAGVAIASRFHETNQARKENRHVWHEVICTIEASVIADKTVPHDKKVKFVKFYDALLVNSVHAKACNFDIPRRQQ